MPRTFTTDRTKVQHDDFLSALESAGQAALGEEFEPDMLRSPTDIPEFKASMPLHTVPDLWGSNLYVAPDAISRRYAEDPASETPRELRPETDRSSIAAELKLGPRLSREAIYRIRREFALANHPDLFGPAQHETATLRMTMANMLIDEELRKRS